MKKSYNPFKMWGSWVGAVLSFFLFLTGFDAEKNALNSFVHIIMYPMTLFYSLLDLIGLNIYGELYLSIALFLIPLGYGFLIGWLIQSLWRKFRK